MPFEPLTPEVAAKVVDKASSASYSHAGACASATRSSTRAPRSAYAVADAFDPRYGARTVKRWLEDHVAGALTDLLAVAPPARLTVIRLAEDAGTIAATIEPMLERTPIPGPYLLEGALDLATARLEPAIATAAAAIARVRGSRELARGTAEATGELRYYVDELGQRLDALDQLFGIRARVPEPAPDPDDEHEASHETRMIRDGGGDHREIRFRTRGTRRPPRTPASRDALIAGIAEAMLIERSLPMLLDPDSHAVTVLISRIGTANADGLIQVTQVFAHQPAWFEAGVQADYAGEIGPVIVGTAAKGAAMTFAQWQQFWRARRDIVLVLRGLFVREALATDHGTWMVRAATAEPDIVRVEVRPGATRAPIDVLREHLAQRRELERVLDAGGQMPPNPDILLPVTRTIAYRAPLRHGDLYSVEIEDFATGWIDRGKVKDIPSAVRRGWQLSWSRHR